MRLLVGSSLFGCEQATGPVSPPPPHCSDPSAIEPTGLFPTRHRATDTVTGQPATLAGTTWASPAAVTAFFGGKDVKLVFTANRIMYLLSYSGGVSTLTRISHGDESLGGQPGTINSPLFSPDGSKIVFAGTTLGRPAFVQEAVPGKAMRIPIDKTKAHVTSDPHWHVEGGKTYVYFASLTGVVKFSDYCKQIPGSTYRKELLGDSMGAVETTGIPGAYRGGLSLDGEWAGTSYATSTLWHRTDNRVVVLAGARQQCNPSMNPYPPGSLHTDYMMILAFGGKYATVADSMSEGLHENLWIYNKDNKAVWRAKRPDESHYLRWDKPEWSTHPLYATAVALPRGDENNGDIVIVKIGDLANAPEDSLHEAQDYLKIGVGGFTEDSYTHLWVGD